MKVQLKIFLFLFAIVTIAAFFRFNQLGNNPPSLTWDEAAWGYNAYSLGMDGKDEFGRFLPHDYLESFGDFKPPMYAYLDIIPVKLFGLTPFATRFPSAFMGTLTVLITYFLVKRIFSQITNYEVRSKEKTLKIKNLKSKIEDNSYIEYLALVSALILAVSPWHIMLSRAAFEANVATFFLVVGIWLFLGAVQEKKWYLPLSIVSFVASLYTFNSSRVVAPLLVIILTIGFWKVLWNRKQCALLAIVVGIFLILPTGKFLLSPQASLRFKEVNIFSDISVIRTTNQEIINDHNAWWSKIIHNRRIAYGGEFIRHYFDNLSTNFLFIHGDGNPKFSTQDVGEMYLWDIPFFVAGILFLVKKKEGTWWIIPLWLLIGIIPAATARETPHALRIEATLPTFQIITAYGFTTILLMVKKYKQVILTSLYVMLLFNVLYFLHGYYTHYPKEFSAEWQYGYKDSIAYAASQYNNYSSIQVAQSLGRPYIYYLFFTKTNPEFFRETAKVRRDAFGFVTVEQFGKYSFVRSTNEKFTTTAMFIDVPGDVPKNAKVLKTFYLLNGEAILKAYTL